MHPLVFHPRVKEGHTTALIERPRGSKALATNTQGRKLPFDLRTLADGTLVGISASGDHAFLQRSELKALIDDPAMLPLMRKAELAARFFFPNHGRNLGKERLLAARLAAKRETVAAGPSLHIIVPTLQCGHTCQYCQVSRAQTDLGFSMTPEMLDAACARIWESTADVLTIEFQGGDPLLRFDLIVRAVEKLTRMNHEGRKRLRFVVASTLHQLTEEMCDFFRTYDVVLSTSLDGPAQLHNRNRPVPGRDSYQRTLEGIALARQRIGQHAVSALMTTTKASLAFPEEIVDEYVRLGMDEIFLRPLSIYGFAKRNLTRLGYTQEEFQAFYERALRRVLWWNEKGVQLREVYMSIVMNKILSTFDAGYVDLQSPTGAGSSVLVYNYDGWVYPSDEARMLVETGDASLRMGRVTDSLDQLLASTTRQQLRQASETAAVDCAACAYRHYCAPNPVDSQAQFGRPDMPALQTEHCGRHQWLFDTAFTLLHAADTDAEEMFHIWARPSGMQEARCDR
ncbi:MULTISPECIES: His-Xaa-Ser system radical SAM maturase HxsB [unclassified Massilia]|uniref:His-Xaa-Ser system radical SAM maturase HxsB n=1 Tax=unclassified Massilia TaxID=2609279 RepID=UPI00177EED3A|nr:MULTISPECIES: His-Xaa-Ser system radical SAM maturase HxsB [unclassified Massilia]MBD8532930.1 His-Xaa-Ser system radical SAM maturase HxsB [Massilia sp. CFBP 13647]MBD8676306.1 His-Xaa-Ser system radical SAM maturase HxsB [Massilia sp. CFBP 13721]